MSSTLTGRARVQRTLAWLCAGLCLALAVIVYGCASPQRFQSAPRPSRRYTQNRQRQHARERRQDGRRNHSPISWSGQ